MSDDSTEDSRGAKKVTGLVQYCQRVLIAHIDAVSSFGEGVPHRLIRPILQGCNADTLLRLEQETPVSLYELGRDISRLTFHQHLQEHTAELWKDLCFRNYPVITQQLQDDYEEPESWRRVLFHLKEKEAVRLEEASSKIRNQRLEADGLKRKRQVKLTDRLPLPKRPRHGCSTGPSPPKTLFERTRREATKIQKNMFGTRTLPTPIVNSKGFRAKLSAPSAQLTTNDTEPVAVTTVTVRTSRTPSSSQMRRSMDSSFKLPPDPSNRSRSAFHEQKVIPSGSIVGPEKSLMESSFSPKQRAYSQLPHSTSSSSR
ncbi:hypothetical protein DFH11DRAFT_1541493 [Phellopilus nigrolimitatus]|nr:hypothetical protein DFH11DRAFT_1541493 [Phellopilus nigrolimitatus]